MLLQEKGFSKNGQKQNRIELRSCKFDSSFCHVFINEKYVDELTWEEAMEKFAAFF